MLAGLLLFSLSLTPEAPFAIADAFLSRISDSTRLINGIKHLIQVTYKLALISEKRSILDSDLMHCATKTSLRKTSQLLAAGYPNHPRLHRFVFARAAELGILETPPKPILTGKDLLDLGIEPGPQFKEILSDFYNAQLNGKIVSKAQAVQLLTRLFEEDSEEE